MLGSFGPLDAYASHPFNMPSPPEPSSPAEGHSGRTSPPDPYFENLAYWDALAAGPTAESPDDYRPGGYHPVAIADRFRDQRYRVVRKLGWGGSCTVWLAHDQQLDRHVALKVTRASEAYTQVAQNEIKLHQRAAAANPAHPGHAHVVALLDHFTHEGPNGTHTCLVFEPLGEDLAALSRRLGRNGMPAPLVRQIGRDVLRGLDYLHRECGIVHTALKAENVLVAIPDVQHLIRAELQEPLKTAQDTNTSWPLLAPHIQTSRPENHPQPDYSPVDVKLCDLGNAPAPAAADPSVWLQTAAYRSPEVIIEAPWDRRVDIWSVGCLIFELLAGSHLFHTPAEYNRDDHLSQIVDLLGKFPTHMITAGKYIPMHIYDMEIMKKMQKMEDWCLRSMMAFNGFDSEIIGCLEAILIVDPAKRPDARQILDDPDNWLGPEKTE
ncbi:hypothetical protein PtA15_5A662 [Puccinia triticina]|uniref:non-specific serine/threonine protein kinase n=1 Tax=Puccinia triticina TaxID=208348 RepID=A0ABY7CIQ6_9BASI|nr:uncharacterized protein PtA15_5A662 [Puccinia triticina]WAQ85088.1 hypothetical protein PtA15_5A662 [Puccinia triticina]WAR58421.1 hypothetical protein PtB15_5B655 [Puccinia triticina]